MYSIKAGTLSSHKFTETSTFGEQLNAQQGISLGIKVIISLRHLKLGNLFSAHFFCPGSVASRKCDVPTQKCNTTT